MLAHWEVEWRVEEACGWVELCADHNTYKRGED